MTLQSDFEKFDEAVKELGRTLRAERKIIVAFFAGFLIANVILAIIWLVQPERFC